MDKRTTKKDLLSLDKKILLLTGSFDLLHEGHKYLINEAKRNVPEDVLIVVILLNDENIRNRKGPGRPIQSEFERAKALIENPQIDKVLLWKDNWKGIPEFVLKLKPSFMAIVEGDPGFDSKINTINSYGGQVIVVKKYKDISTTKILEDREKL